MDRRLGRYELLAPLARGGMAEVFIGRRRGPAGVDKRVVVKRIRAERAGDAHHLDLFIREAQVSMSLAHKNLVPVFDFGRVGDRLFLAMELIEGRDLATTIKRAVQRTKLPDPVLIAHLGAELCQGLDYAHKKRGPDGLPQGLVHRDVKPANVMVSFAGEVKLLDFGVASLGALPDRAGALRGTVGYMAPEQARGEGLDARADVFSLGLVLWEALAGRPAFDTGGDDRARLERARRGEVAPLPDGVPKPLRDAITRATAADPQARFPDAQAFGRALDAFALSARAASPDGGGLDERLAAWMHELFGGEAAAPSGPGPGEPEQAFVTFLDDGLESVAATAATSATSATAASHGPEDEVRTAPVAAALARAATPVPAAATPTTGARWLRPLILVGGLGAIVATVAMTTGGEPSKPPLAAPAAGALARAPADAAAVTRGGSPGLAGRGGEAPLIDARPIVPDAAPVPVPDAAPTRPRPVRPVVPRGTGVVRITTTPWATVTVGGRQLCADTPCQITLPAGPTTLKLANPVAGVARDVRIVVPAGGELVVREALVR